MIKTIAKSVRQFAGDRAGSVVVETAFVAPMLVLMSIGSFEVSHMVARQHELQSGAAEAEAVALAANMGAETNAPALEDMLEANLGLDDDEVTVTIVYRCNANDYLVNSADYCGGGEEDDDTVISRYVRLQLSDTYTPIWAKIGVGKDLTYSVDRMVQLS